MNAPPLRLTDRQIEGLLRARSADADASLLGEIMAATRDVPQRRARWGALPLDQRRYVVLIAAALLTALLIGGTLAVGAGLIRLPWLQDDRRDTILSPLAGPVANCWRSLPDGVALIVLDSAESSQLTVYEDGLAITGFPADWGAQAAVSLDGSWSQRRLAADGLQRLIDATTGTLPSCQTFESASNMEIHARLGGGMYSIRLGSDILETRLTSPAQAAAAQGLVDRFADADLGLSASDWAEPAWNPYTPDRWRFWLRFNPADDPGFPLADSIRLPDGSPLGDFGVEQPPEPESTAARCAVTDETDARAIAEILTSAGGRPDDLGSGDPYWYFTAGGPDQMLTIELVGLLPHQPDCQSQLGAAATPTPAPAPSAPAGEPMPLADACDYVPAALVQDVIGPIEGETEHYPGWSDDWAFCWQPVEGDGLAIAAIRRPVAGDRAAAQAQSLFGAEGFTTEQIGGRDVFVRSCGLPEAQCRATIAISVEPHFVVLMWSSEATLRELAELVIQELVTSN
jgi:hypothetical protein